MVSLVQFHHNMDTAHARNASPGTLRKQRVLADDEGNFSLDWKSNGKLELDIMEH
jgi:hypothetical protein